MVESLRRAWRRFSVGCWLSHGAMLRERRGGNYLLVCERCGRGAAVLPGQRLRVRLTARKVLAMRRRA